MIIENNIIVEATERELLKLYFEKGYEDFMSFKEYTIQLKSMGVKIVDES